MEMSQADIEKAYLNAVASEKIFMEQPQGFQLGKHPHWACKLQQSLYRIMQAGHDFWNGLDGTYKKLGFSRSKANECIWMWIDKDGIAITATYTDDIMGVADTQRGLECIREDLNSQYRLSGEGDFKYMLGIAIKRNQELGTITLSQEAYATHVLECYGMLECNPVATPLPPGQKTWKITC
jgi:hypothetical protein